MKAIPVSIAVVANDKLELFAFDFGDGNSFDHACWLNPHFLGQIDKQLSNALKLESEL